MDWENMSENEREWWEDIHAAMARIYRAAGIPINRPETHRSRGSSTSSLQRLIVRDLKMRYPSYDFFACEEVFTIRVTCRKSEDHGKAYRHKPGRTALIDCCSMLSNKLIADIGRWLVHGVDVSDAEILPMEDKQETIVCSSCKGEGRICGGHAFANAYLRCIVCGGTGTVPKQAIEYTVWHKLDFGKGFPFTITNCP